jgi:hypothetical protein
MQRSVADAGGGLKYGLGWWIEEDRFGYRSLPAQGGTDDASASLRVIPEEGIAVAVLANTGTQLLDQVIDKVLDILLPGYAARRKESDVTDPSRPDTQSATFSSLAGTWHGHVKTPSAAVPVLMQISEEGRIEARVDGCKVR